MTNTPSAYSKIFRKFNTSFMPNQYAPNENPNIVLHDPKFHMEEKTWRSNYDNFKGGSDGRICRTRERLIIRQ